MFGKYDEYLTIQTRTTASDSAGGRTPTWAVYAYTFGNVREATGSEVFKAQQAQNPVSMVVTIPDSDSSKDYTPRMRIVRADGSTRLEIKAVKKSARLKKEIIFDCDLERAA